MALPIVRRIREIFESIAYAGLQPGARAGQTKRIKWLGPLSGPIERLLSGGPAPSDPLYLTNRTTGQKIKLGVAIGVPCLVLAGLVYGMLTNSFDFGGPPPAHEATASEVAAKLLPHMDPNMHIDTDKDVEVVEVRVEHGAQMTLVGSMKNTTDHEIHIAEAVFDLTDSGGSQLGGVSARIENFKAKSTANFRIPIQQTEASFALVREIHTR
ncbi:MAG: FxLYD domain-containing protein [Bryobacteraceae bacterium]